MLADARVSTRLPAKDLARARRFYSEKLGLEPVEERPGGLRYQCGGSSFALFESATSFRGMRIPSSKSGLPLFDKEGLGGDFSTCS